MYIRNGIIPDSIVIVLSTRFFTSSDKPVPSFPVNSIISYKYIVIIRRNVTLL